MPLIIPTPKLRDRFRSINLALAQFKERHDPRDLMKACELAVADSSFSPAKKELKTIRDLEGLIWSYVYTYLNQRDYVAVAMMLWGTDVFNPEPHCVQLVWDALFKDRMINVIGGGGLGKCLGPDVPVTMFDGSQRPACEIKVGDLLMGDNGKRRLVLAANPGVGPMYRIKPERGEAWTCNDEHILTLRCNSSKRSGNGQPSRKYVKDKIYDVPLKDYLSWGINKQEKFCLFNVGVEMPERPLPFDPYIYGSWLGDGSFDAPALHTPEGPMSRAWTNYFNSMPGFHVTVGYLDRCPMWCARIAANKTGGGRPNPFTNFIRTSRANSEKIILDDYLINSRVNRLKLLAGMIDSDGWVEGRSAYCFVSKYETLAKQVCRLARSLGFGATARPRVKKIARIGFEGIYWHVYISGENITDIPTLEKHAAPNVSNKNLTNTRFSVTAIGKGEFYGFVIDGNHRFLLGDFTVTHNTYGPSAWFLLDWLLDPHWTRIQVASNSEDHLKKNLFADIIRLHAESVLSLPGEPDAESISLNKKMGMGIFILTIPGGPNSKGKIKGAHTKPRPEHRLFGKRSRVRMIIDEGQEVAQNIFAEIPNRFTTVLPGDNEHIKFVVCANPKDPYSPFGQCCKPMGGWDKIESGQEIWESEKGWRVISLNAMTHENVRARKVIYPGFVTYEGVQVWLRACHGDPDHPDMWTYVYGRFPPQGTTQAVIPQKFLEKSNGEWIFDSETQNYAHFDPAFTGDLPAMAIGRVGRAIGWMDIAGEEHRLKQREIKIQIDAVGILPRGDTQQLADEVMARLKQLSIKPHHFGIDKTGVGLGVHDVIRRQWKQKVGSFNIKDRPDIEGFDGDENVAPIYGINFSQEATQVRVAEEDTLLPKEMYDGIRSEVWFAGARLFEFDVIRMSRAVEPKAYEELSSRRGGRPVGKGTKLQVEKKDDYKARTGNNSPDRADAILGLIHIARITTEKLLPKAEDTVVKADPRPYEDKEIEEFGSMEIAGFEAKQDFDRRD